MQTLAITFTGAPIPFAKIGSFPPSGPIRDIVQGIKESIKAGKSELNAIKESFSLTAANASSSIVQNLEKAEVSLNEMTANGFARLQTTLPALFTRTGAVANARTTLLSRLGSVTDYANDPQNRILGMTVSQWSVAGNTLYESMQSFKNHNYNLAGVNVDDRLIIGQEIYGNIAVPGTINISSSNVATANLSKTQYPTLNVGDVVAVSASLYTVTGKIYTIASGGGSVNFDAGNTIVTTSSLSTLNLASIALDVGSTLRVSPGIYINVNNEIKQVDAVNSRGDFLTVTTPFRNSNSSAPLFKEVGFTVNTNFTSTNSDISVARNTAFVANSECLDNVITGRGTTFASSISVGDKIYYDDLEYFVEAVTNTSITVDAPLRGREDMMVYKVMDEKYVQRFSETYDPEDIIDDFSLMRELFDGMPPNPDGSPWYSDLSTRYRASNGQYVSVSVYNPTDVARSLDKSPSYTRAIKKTIQDLIDDLQDDSIRSMSDNELVLYLENKTNEIDSLTNLINDSVNQDIAAINAVKGLIKGLLKFWKHSCSRKNLKTGEEAVADDEFLESVLVPNPVRQGCSATESDLIDILNQFSVSLDTPENEPAPPQPPVVPAEVDLDLFNVVPDSIYALERQRAAGNTSDIIIDSDPDPTLPPEIEDPCVKPC